VLIQKVEKKKIKENSRGTKAQHYTTFGIPIKPKLKRKNSTIKTKKKVKIKNMIE